MDSLPKDKEAFSKVAQSLSHVEKEYYTMLWQTACGEDLLRGKAAFDFLSKSNLPREILKRIWDIADWQKRGLAWEEFVVTLKLISAAQKKQLVSWDRVLQSCGPTSRDLPVFDGIQAPAEDAPGTQKLDLFAEFEALAHSEEPAQAVPQPVTQPVTQALPQLVEQPVTEPLPVPAAVQPAPAHLDSPEAPGATSHEAHEAPWDASFDTWHQAEAAAPAQAESSVPGCEAETWDAFGASEVALSEAQAVQVDHLEQAAEEPEEWAAFESASVPAPTAPTPAPTGDLWSKMSAFDDLLDGGPPQGPSIELEPVVEPSQPVVELPVQGDADEDDFGDFAAPALPSEVEPATGGSINFLDFSPSGPSGPSGSGTSGAEAADAVGPQGAGFEATFDAFEDFGSAPAGSAAEKVTSGGLLDLADDLDFGQSSVPESAQEVWAAFPEQGEEPPQEEWDAFGEDQGWASFTGPPVPEVQVASPSEQPEAPSPEAPGTEAEEQDEAGSLTQSLCSLGRFEEALKCKANGDILRRLHLAEEKKKEAVAKDDFEGAIQLRSEIQELGSRLVSEEILEVWRNLARGERDGSLESAEEDLRQRCQWMDGFSSAALKVAMGNFRRACPEHRRDGLSVLPSLVRQQRRARQMCRAIEAISSQNVLLFLQVILVCIQTLCELLSECSSISTLADPDWSDEERDCVRESEELQGLLQGLSSLRRLLWRLGLAAELFMSEGEGPTDTPDARALQELQGSLASSLAKAKARWAKLESDILSLRLKMEPWLEANTYEAGGCANGEQTAPLCRLCLLPAVPLGVEVEDEGAASMPWRGGHWHVQCANFWLRHASCSWRFKDLKVNDPFEYSGS